MPGSKQMGSQLVLSFSSGHHLYSVFSAPHFMLSQVQFQRRKNVLKQERLPSSALVLHIRILGFCPTERLFSVQMVMIHQNKTRIPLQIVNKVFWDEESMHYSGLQQAVYPHEWVCGVRRSSPSSYLHQPRAAQHHPSSLNWGVQFSCSTNTQQV